MSKCARAIGYRAGKKENAMAREEQEEIERLSRQLEALETGRRAKVDRLAAMYADQLQQTNHAYQAKEEILRLSNEVDYDLLVHYDLMRRMKKLLDSLTQCSEENVK
ncbi:MAG: hypothetical protein PHD32_02890 [Eubacteriales bacterium]|nr:hypothetical protein [Eubacteriales bacterium]